MDETIDPYQGKKGDTAARHPNRKARHGGETGSRLTLVEIN